MLFLIGVCIAACTDDNAPDKIIPIHFGKTDHTIMYGQMSTIPFTGGGGVYELTASNPDVLGEFWIDLETNDRLYIQPAKTGNSYLTIRDVNAETTITLHFTVEDFYLSFRIDQIEGENTNEFFDVGREIRFIRNEANTKPVKVIWCQNNTFRPITIATGVFGIARSETNIFTMQFALHHKEGEELASYEYVMGGDGEYMTMFDRIFDFGWENKSIACSSKSQPVSRIQMILTDRNNGSKTTCSLQPYRWE